MEIGYTRDLDNPNSDKGEREGTGLSVQFFTLYRERFHADGNPIVENGRPVIGKKVGIRFVTLADSKNHPERIATETDKLTYKGAWEAFQRGEVYTSQRGTPIAKLPGMELLQERGFQAKGIETVEQLAELPENVILSMGLGARHWRTQAQAYLMEHTPKPDQVAAERMAVLEAQIRELQSQLAPGGAPQPIVQAVSMEEKARRDQERREANDANQPENPLRRKRGPNKPKPQPVLQGDAA